MSEKTNDKNADESDVEIESTEAVSESSDAQNEEMNRLKNDFLYLKAEFDNYKKQAIKERSDLIKYSNERMLVEFLNLMDVFDQALTIELTPDTLEKYKKGIELTATEFKNILNKFGVETMDSLGKPFDPAIHEALGSEETDTMDPGHILRIFKKPYKLHGRLIRPAQVIVAKEKTSEPKGQQ